MDFLENVEKVVASSNAKEKATKEMAAKESIEKATGKRDKGKRKGTNSHDYRIPKKANVEKSCSLCQKHEGACTIKMELYKRVSVGKQPLDKSATAAVRLLIPSCRLWNASQNSRTWSKRPRSPGRQRL